MLAIGGPWAPLSRTAPSNLRLLPGPRTGGFQRGADAQRHGVLEPVGDDLQADRQAFGREPGRNGERRALAGAVERLLTDVALRNRVINAAREKVVREFDNRILINELSDIYRQCLKMPKMI